MLGHNKNSYFILNNNIYFFENFLTLNGKTACHTNIMYVSARMPRMYPKMDYVPENVLVITDFSNRCRSGYVLLSFSNKIG